MEVATVKKRGWTNKLKQSIWKRDGFKCKYCGLYMGDLYQQWKSGKIKRKDALLTVDHIVPRTLNRRERRWTEENMVTSCRKCNNLKADKILL